MKESPARKDRGLVVWGAFAVIALVLMTSIVTAWLVRHAMSDGPRLTRAQKAFVLSVSEFPSLTRAAIVEIRQVFDPTPIALLMERQYIEKRHWQRRFPAPEDSGYLLFSGVDPAAKHSLVRLIRIADGSEVARWDPDWDAVYRKITGKKETARGSPHSAIASHPLLLPDGDIVFNTTHALVRMGPCSRSPVWVLDELMHHSNELAADGTIWTPSVAANAFPDNSWLEERIRDDSLARVSPEGRLLENQSLATILRDNGLQSLLLGTTGGVSLADPIHLNEIKAAPSDTKYWRKGDLLLSARHLSSVFLYRPSTRRIVWYQTGPWMNQHSPDFVDDHRISIFDNNVYAGAPSGYAFVSKGDINRVFVYDFDTGKTTQPFAELLAKARPVTITDGRARILPDGGLFIEETNSARHLRFTQDRLLWSRVNDYDQERIGVVAWSRYLTAEEAQAPMKALASRACPRQ